MALRPTVDQLKVLQSVVESGTGIDAVSKRDEGFACVECGWLDHREHRREEGGVIDVWDLTAEGRQILADSARQAHSHSLPEERAA